MLLRQALSYEDVWSFKSTGPFERRTTVAVRSYGLFVKKEMFLNWTAIIFVSCCQIVEWYVKQHVIYLKSLAGHNKD